jgi:hypothetical protein
MKRYTVRIPETHTYIVEVMANSKEEAIGKAAVGLTVADDGLEFEQRAHLSEWEIEESD